MEQVHTPTDICTTNLQLLGVFCSRRKYFSILSQKVICVLIDSRVKRLFVPQAYRDHASIEET